MYKWYEKSAVCYAYLEGVGVEDVRAYQTNNSDDTSDDETDSAGHKFAQHRWFQRGWTLQELISPSSVVFYGENWVYLGLSINLAQELESITGITKQILTSLRAAKNFFLRRASIAQKMSWAAKRNTTRIEDQAYSLLGIFGVHLPLLYGEGSAAFVRLQEEIIRVSTDQSIFAWPCKIEETFDDMLLASSPSYFEKCGSVVALARAEVSESFSLTNAGLSITLPVIDHPKVLVAVLSCGFADGAPGAIGIKLSYADDQSWHIRSYPPVVRSYRRDVGGRIVVIDHKTAEEGFERHKKAVVLLRKPVERDLEPLARHFEATEELKLNRPSTVWIEENFGTCWDIGHEWDLRMHVQQLYSSVPWRRAPVTGLNVTQLWPKDGAGCILIDYRRFLFVITFGFEKQNWNREAPSLWINIQSFYPGATLTNYIELDQTKASNASTVIFEDSNGNLPVSGRSRISHELYGFATRKWGHKRVLVSGLFPDDRLTVEICPVFGLGELAFEIRGKAEKITMPNINLLREKQSTLMIDNLPAMIGFG